MVMPRMRKRGTYLAAVAQLAEQLFCKHQVFSSILNSGLSHQCERTV